MDDAPPRRRIGLGPQRLGQLVDSASVNGSRCKAEIRDGGMPSVSSAGAYKSPLSARVVPMNKIGTSDGGDRIARKSASAVGVGPLQILDDEHERAQRGDRRTSSRTAANSRSRRACGSSAS